MSAAIKLVSPLNETVMQLEQKDYLLPGEVRQEEEPSSSFDEFKSLLVEVQALRLQLAHSQHMLKQQEALLHNAKVRELELRASLFSSV